MTLDNQTTVRDLVVGIPGATRLFEKMGIDYCCHGGQSLQEACHNIGLKVEDVVQSLEELKRGGPEEPSNTNWQEVPLTRLISHIVETHHQFTRDESARLSSLAAKVCGVHGANHVELLEIRETLVQLQEELIDHMQKEEAILFPYLQSMEQASVDQKPLLPPFFRTVLNPIEIMMTDHESAGQSLDHIRKLSSDFAVPPDGCASFRALYEGLEGLEKDLHQHIHLENNILFPRSARLETEVRSR